MSEPRAVAQVDLDTLRVQVEGLDEEDSVGSGAFGVVYSVTVDGKKCIAKKLHNILTQAFKHYPGGQDDTIVRKFEQECRILSQLKHPNVVGFVGVHYGRDRTVDISLIMEKLFCDLAEFVKTNPDTHLSLRLHILHDVSKGLDYLHSQQPQPLIHRDLTAPNVLLTESVIAKIGDLGVSRYVDPRDASSLTTNPGNLLFMPPESRVKNPSYTTKLDIFSFGNLIIHTVTGELPKVYDVPHGDPRFSQYMDDGKIELMRREEAVYKRIGETHCLYHLMVLCLHDSPEGRPSVGEVRSSLRELSSSWPRTVLGKSTGPTYTTEEHVLASKLFTACERGNVEALEDLIRNEPCAVAVIKSMHDRHSQNIAEKTIIAAIRKGYYDIVKCLLQAGVSPNIHTGEGVPLVVACTEGKLSILKHLINQGADYLSIDNPPLVFTACAAGHLDCLKYLMEKMKYDIHQTASGHSAHEVDGRDSLLFCACQTNCVEVASYLVENRALITLTITEQFLDIIKDVLQQKFQLSGEPNPKQLYHARLDDLSLVKIPWSVFADYSETLVHLNLQTNSLPSIPDKLFQLPMLKVLDISHNQLSVICTKEVVWSCTNLVEFDASHNKLAEVPSQLFQMPELTVLQLSNNSLEHLPGDPNGPDAESMSDCENIWGCSKLKKLDVSCNSLQELPNCFYKLKQLSLLRASQNELENLPQSIGLDCINLVHLDVSENNLTNLPKGCARAWMQTLEQLFLSHNKFSEISQDVAELEHLTTLDLSHNHIECLPATSLWTGSWLRKLDLSSNRLSVLTHKPSKVVPPQPVDKREPLRVRLSKRTSKKPTFKSHEPQTCPIQESSFDDTPREFPVHLWRFSLRSLHLQGNGIKFLPDYIGDFVNLARLNISSNPEITELPLTLGRLYNFLELSLRGLSITNVPNELLQLEVVRDESMKHLLAYLRAQLRHCVPYNRLKLMAVGPRGQGKTTLLSALHHHSSEVCTGGMVISDWTVHPPRGDQRRGKHNTEVVFSVWDMGSHEAFHKCFLSQNTLYLLVWNMEEGARGLDSLEPWLLNIQAKAPKSPIFIVGTHLDKSPYKRTLNVFEQRIQDLYSSSHGYPHITGIMMVSGTTREGTKELTEGIYNAAVNLIHSDTEEHVIGMQVPSSCMALQKKLSEEAVRYKEKGIPPVLNQKAFSRLAQSVDPEDTDIMDSAELLLVSQLLHENGTLLHYTNHLRGLNDLYFIDPVWLADMLAEIVAVLDTSFVHNGILQESKLELNLSYNQRFSSSFFNQFLQLLEQLDIAQSLGNGLLFIPSMLPLQRPIMNFVCCELTTLTLEDKVAHATPTGEDRDKIPLPVDSFNPLRRRYKMAFIPSGFWSRLISRLLINLKRSGLDESKEGLKDPLLTYWRYGILIGHSTGKFLVEAIHAGTKKELLGFGINDTRKEKPILMGEGVDAPADSLRGVDICVWSNNGNFSAMGYVVDQLDSLIAKEFPTLSNMDVQSELLVHRQVLCPIPSKQVNKDAMTHRETWDLSAISNFREEVYIIPLEKCAAEALQGDTLACPGYGSFVPLSYLVPDLLLTDLPPELTIDLSQLEYNLKDPTTQLGRGGTGGIYKPVLYKGRYKNKPVAIKEFPRAQDNPNHKDEAKNKITTQGEALRVFRQKSTVLAKLSHPNIIALLGVCIRPMYMITELAPMGSLCRILSRKLEQIKAVQVKNECNIIRLPGGILGHDMSAKIALQVALAIRYLHKHGIFYLDIKSENVLVWSLDVNDPINIKLADYPISRFKETPELLAPEAVQARENPLFNEKVDIFSYGSLLFELLTGQHPFENLTLTQKQKAVLCGNHPPIYEGNADPTFPGMVDLMSDTWRQSSAERPSADEIVSRVCKPGFICRQHTLLRMKDHILQKIDCLCARPDQNEDVKEEGSFAIWTWSKQHAERNFSVIDVQRGVFTLPKKPAAGGRASAITSAGNGEERIWIGTHDFSIQVYGSIKRGDPQCLWTFRMMDTVLALVTEVERNRVKRVFASLANGSLCVFSRKSAQQQQKSIGDAKLIPKACTMNCKNKQFQREAEEWATPLILFLGESKKATKCMVFVGQEQLWCGHGNTVVVVDIVNMKVLKSIPVFMKENTLVNELVSKGNRVWGVGRQLSCVMEWDTNTLSLLHIFNCNLIDPTGETIISNAKLVDDLVDPESRLPAATISLPISSQSPTDNTVSDSPESSAPLPHSSSHHLPNVKKDVGRSERAATSSLPIQELNQHVQKGSTRTTSLLILGETLWVARGMGDILVIDISNKQDHGRVLARLATEGCEKFGNRSYHKLVCVGGKYVVSSQWLEPVDVPPQTVSISGAPDTLSVAASQTADNSTHQAITIWNAWNSERFCQFKHRCSLQLRVETGSTV